MGFQQRAQPLSTFHFLSISNTLPHSLTVAYCYKFSLSNHASSLYVVLLIADALRHPQLVLVIMTRF
jgi:hypothetical protein